MVRDISNYLGNFFQQKIKQHELTAYYVFVNKQTIEETEDEVVIRTRKGLTIEPRVNWSNESPTFLKNNATNALYHLQIKNQESKFRHYDVNSACIVEKIGNKFNPKKVNIFPDRTWEIPLEMLAGRLIIEYKEAGFEGDHWCKKSSLYEIRIQKELDYLLHEFLRYAIKSPFPLITQIAKAPVGAWSIVENIPAGYLSFPNREGNISVCEDYNPKEK